MQLHKLALTGITLLGLAAARPAEAGQVFYAIGDGGASLVRIDADSPGSATRVGNFSGGASFLDGLDLRPADGQLYGYLNSSNSLYTVNPATGALTFVSQPTTPTNTFVLGLDFNPMADRLRVVTESQQNLRINVATGATTNDGTLTYAATDVNANSPSTHIVEAAYTNNVPGATSTKLYYIDYTLDTLVTTTAPNDGILTTVGNTANNLGVDTSEYVGFDIVTDSAGRDSAFALLTVGGVAGLYSIDLATGAATLDGTLPAELGQVYGLAAVPEPASLLLGAIGLAGLAGLAHRRRRRA